MSQQSSKHIEKRSNEPFWWALFGAGGMVAALSIPILLLLTGLAIPLGWMDAPDYESLYRLFENPISRLVILTIVSLSSFHWAHRFRFTLYDGLHLKHLNAPVAIFCYGCAIFFSAYAAYSLYLF